MIKRHALFFTVAIALLGTPALAQDRHGHDSATSAPIGPAMMNDIRFTMGTIMNDPVIVKRMNQLMGSNSQFKRHYEQMRGLMTSQGWMMNAQGGMMNGRGGMMNGGNGNYGPMMSTTPTPTPKP